ncbi:MAG: hypothetical protein HY746_08450 [Elusimicrobia bacterium]|nr:hypothetical protein [Elusimicrobiota bacterium]
MRKHIFLAFAAIILSACAGSDILYRPAGQKLPQHIKRISVRPFINKTERLGLEEKLTLKVIDEFLKNGEYGIADENSSHGVVIGEIAHYLSTPIQYDVNLVPTVYKINIIASVKFLDKSNPNHYIWEEPAMQASMLFSAPTLPGGMTEEQAREELWKTLAKDIVLRTVQGFGSATSISQKKLPPVQQSTSTVKSD